MRQIIFRGKSEAKTFNGKWIYGELSSYPGRGRFMDDGTYEDGVRKYYIRPEGEAWLPVIPSSVGEYTGLMDKDGIKIFEGDICKIFDDDFEGEVVFDDGAFCVFIDKNQTSPLYELDCITVVGNVTDSPISPGKDKEDQQ